jgi:hypothetical protein
MDDADAVKIGPEQALSSGCVDALEVIRHADNFDRKVY